MAAASGAAQKRHAQRGAGSWARGEPRGGVMHQEAVVQHRYRICWRAHHHDMGISFLHTAAVPVNQASRGTLLR